MLGYGDFNLDKSPGDPPQVSSMDTSPQVHSIETPFRFGGFESCKFSANLCLA